MINRRLLIFTALFFILLMIIGSTVLNSMLLLPVISEPYLPLGTLIAWFAILGLSALPLLTSQKIRNDRSLIPLSLRFLSYIIIGLAVLWPLAGYLLAGNLNFTFKPSDTFTGSVEAGYIYWRYTALLVVLPLIVFLILWSYLLYQKLVSDKK